ncbi:MAG: hypothetical protein U0228_06815 [Myxococcaceae bacterium]
MSCAAPDAHRKPVAGSALDPATPAGARAAVASTLGGDDPLSASSCTLPSLSRECAEAAPSGHHHHPMPMAAPAFEEGRDPVCGMKVDPAKAAATLELDGHRVSFCSKRCRDTFLGQHPTAKEVP